MAAITSWLRNDSSAQSSSASACPLNRTDDLDLRIKIADRASAYLEATALAGFSIAEARKLFGEPDLPIRNFAAFLEPMRPSDVETRFLARFAELDAEVARTL